MVSGLFQHEYIEEYKKKTRKNPRAGYEACNFTSEFVKWLITEKFEEELDALADDIAEDEDLHW